MSFGSESTTGADTQNLSGLNPDTEPTNQEAILGAYWNGTRQVGVQWISPVYNQRAVEAPSTRPGKK